MLRKTYLSAIASLAFTVTASGAVSAAPLTSAATPEPMAVYTQAAETPAKETLLDINTATAAELSAVMIGVGVKRAEEIIKLREQLGGYTELEQLLDVKGIGLKTLEKNKALIRIN